MRGSSGPGRLLSSHQGQLVVVGDDVGRGDPGVGVEARDAEGVVVVPHQPGALVVGVVVLGLVAERLAWAQDLVVHEAEPLLAVRVPPGVRPAVADPGDEPAVQVDVRPVVWLPISPHDGAVDREDVRGRQVVAEGDLDRVAALGGDDAAQVPESPPGRSPTGGSGWAGPGAAGR